MRDPGGPPAPASAKQYATKTVKFQNHQFTLQAFSAHLKSLKRKCRQAWWDEFEVQEVEEKARPGVVVDVKLQCKMCSNSYAALNPSQIAKTHLTERACKRRRAAAAAAAAAGTESHGASGGGSSSSSGGGAGASSSSSSSRPSVRQRTTQGYFATGHQQQQFTVSFSRWMYKSGHSFLSAEHKDLRAALAVAGLLPPTRKELAGPLLDAEYERVTADDKHILKQQALVQLATDGWRRRAVDSGSALINVMALYGTASKFFKVHRASGVVKSAQWLKDMHLEWATEVTEDELHRVLGIVMDNTKANR